MAARKLELVFLKITHFYNSLLIRLHMCVYVHFIIYTVTYSLSLHSVEFDADEGLNTFQEDIYEHEIRLPFTSFGHHEVYWADVVG